MGRLLDAEIVAELAEVLEHLDDAAVIGLEEGLENENGDELVLREGLLRELRGIGRNGFLSEAQGFLNDRSGRLGHGTRGNGSTHASFDAAAGQGIRDFNRATPRLMADERI